MSQSNVSLPTFAAGVGAAVFLFAASLSIPSDAWAEPLRRAERLELPPVKAAAEPGDLAAALDAVDIALTRAGDGSTYHWGHGNGRLAGAIRMTSTFRDADGRICRHLEMQLRLGSYTRRTEGIACRGADGVWSLEG